MNIHLIKYNYYVIPTFFFGIIIILQNVTRNTHINWEDRDII